MHNARCTLQDARCKQINYGDCRKRYSSWLPAANLHYTMLAVASCNQQLCHLLHIISYYYCYYYPGCNCCLMILWGLIGCQTRHWHLKQCDGRDCCQMQPARELYACTVAQLPVRTDVCRAAVHSTPAVLDLHACVSPYGPRVSPCGPRLMYRYRECAWASRPQDQRTAAPTNDFIPKGLPKPDHRQLIEKYMCIFRINAT